MTRAGRRDRRGDTVRTVQIAGPVMDRASPDHCVLRQKKQDRQSRLTNRTKVPADANVIREGFGAPEDEIGRLSLLWIEAVIESQRTIRKTGRPTSLQHKILDTRWMIEGILI